MTPKALSRRRFTDTSEFDTHFRGSISLSPRQSAASVPDQVGSGFQGLAEGLKDVAFGLTGWATARGFGCGVDINSLFTCCGGGRE